jgi:hypothetical protein
MVQLANDSYMKKLKHFDKIEFRKSVIRTLLSNTGIPKPMIDLNTPQLHGGTTCSNDLHDELNSKKHSQKAHDLQRKVTP